MRPPVALLEISDRLNATGLTVIYETVARRTFATTI
jgi:hypothetical protein